MKTLKFSMLIGMMALIVLPAMARKEEYSKTISKTFDISKDATLEIKNKFGKVHCENWDKNTISFEVEITVEASSQEKANKYLDRINIEFSGSSSRVSAITKIDDNLFNKGDNDISIDYMVYMPASISLELSHKFGDAIIGNVHGSSDINISYGSLKVKSLMGNNNELDISFSDGYVGYVKDADIEIKYSEMEIDEAGSLSAESKFSEFQIGEVDVLTLESGYDDDFIGSVRDLDVEADFSDVEIRSLDDRLVAEFDYGELKVKEVDRDFSLIDISNSFSDASIGFSADASFRLVATIKMGDLSYPRDKARLSVVDISFTSNKYEGVIGDDADTSSKVLVEAKNSGVNLFYR